MIFIFLSFVSSKMLFYILILCKYICFLIIYLLFDNKGNGELYSPRLFMFKDAAWELKCKISLLHIV